MSGLSFTGTAQIFLKAMYLTSLYLMGQITYKIQHQNAKFIACLGLKLRVKRGLNNLSFSIGGQTLKIKFLQMALNSCKM